ncbi:MAG: hypothetical protein WC718_00395 [Phycisphaerales bacterium]|jgi:hypothetical protein
MTREQHEQRRERRQQQYARFGEALCDYYERNEPDGEDYFLPDFMSNTIESAIYHAAHGEFDQAAKLLDKDNVATNKKKP